MHEAYKEKLAEKIVARFSAMELRIMEDIIRRIKKTGEITSTADYQINRLTMLGNSTEDIEKFIKDALDASYPEMFELYDKMLEQEYVRNRALYEQVNAQYIPYEENYQLQQSVEALRNQTAGDFENITQSMGFMVDMGGGKRVFTPLSVYYQQHLDEAMTDIAFGAFDYNTVLRRTVTQMVNSGIRTVYYAPQNSSRMYTNRIEVAVRRAVMTGTSKLAGEIAQYNAKQLNTEYFEVSWHEGARPTHREWHGQVWSREELESVCGLGEVTGLCGANCRHSYYPFVPGASERQHTDEWLAAKAREEDTPKYFRGKGYTMYEATQKQRSMETAMRAQREKVHLLKAGGADDETVMLARCKYQGQLNEYAVFSKKMGLVQQRERIYLDMRGKVAPPRPTVAEFPKHGTIRKEAVKGALNDQNDPGYVRRDRHAEKYYQAVRNSKKENIVRTIAKNTKMSEASISKVYDHVFINEYELYGGHRRFDPDYDMSESFRRLREGRDIQEHDLILLHHERLEYELMKKLGLSYREAHKFAESKYNYGEALKAFNERRN